MRGEVLISTPSTAPRIPLLPTGPEADLLCRAALWPTRGLDLTAAMIEGADRPSLLTLALNHRLLPPLFGAIASSGLAGSWPELQVAQRRAGIRALRHAAVTLDLLDLLEKAGCRALVLKGQALSMHLYGQADLRMSSDIDFLIDPLAMRQAHDVMLENGYTPAYRASVETLHLVNKDQVYTSNNIRIELHWRLFDNKHFLPWPFEDLWSNRSFVKLMAGREVPTLPRDRHIFYQTLHGLRHGWKRFRWLVDAAIPLQNEEDTESLLALARTHNFVPSILHAAKLSHDLLGVASPVPLQGTRQQYAKADAIEQHIRRLTALHHASHRGGLAAWFKQRLIEKRLDLTLCPNFQSTLIEIKQYFIGIGDLIDTKLPKRLFFLYPFIRPFLFTRRIFLRKHNRTGAAHKTPPLR